MVSLSNREGGRTRWAVASWFDKLTMKFDKLTMKRYSLCSQVLKTGGEGVSCRGIATTLP